MTTSFEPGFKKFRFDSFGIGNFGTFTMHGTGSTFAMYSSKSEILIERSLNASATSSKFGSVRPSKRKQNRQKNN